MMPKRRNAVASALRRCCAGDRAAQSASRRRLNLDRYDGAGRLRPGFTFPARQDDLAGHSDLDSKPLAGQKRLIPVLGQ